jgi:hypothetical protein
VDADCYGRSISPSVGLGQDEEGSGRRGAREGRHDATSCGEEWRGQERGREWPPSRRPGGGARGRAGGRGSLCPSRTLATPEVWVGQFARPWLLTSEKLGTSLTTSEGRCGAHFRRGDGQEGPRWPAERFRALTRAALVWAAEAADTPVLAWAALYLIRLGASCDAASRRARRSPRRGRLASSCASTWARGGKCAWRSWSSAVRPFVSTWPS